MKSGFNTIDEYIAGQPEAVQAALHEIRAAIKEAAPDAKEKISYQMPAFELNGNLVYFAAWKKHIGFYPGTAAATAAFKDALAGYKQTKGSIHFPLGQPMPVALIRDIVQYRAAENLQKRRKK